MYNKNARTPEQFRKLRASIAMNASRHVYRKILVTSSSYEEGKTFVAANLALSLALSGKTVALVEADLANASFRQLAGLKESQGLTDYLTGKATIDDILQKDGTENMRWIAGGAAVNYPSELFLNDRMNALVDDLSGRFDYVIIDSAPVSATSDAYVLTRLCDLTLYVVRQGKTPRQALVTLEKTNRVNVLKNVQIVLNGIQNRGAGQVALLNKILAPFAGKNKRTA
jgi:capsular exopolysaccharide synthesis family protein